LIVGEKLVLFIGRATGSIGAVPNRQVIVAIRIKAENAPGIKAFAPPVGRA
jgi:hypothetical protein